MRRLSIRRLIRAALSGAALLIPQAVLLAPVAHASLSPATGVPRRPEYWQAAVSGPLLTLQQFDTTASRQILSLRKLDGTAVAYFTIDGFGVLTGAATVGNYATGSLPTTQPAGSIAYDSTVSALKWYNGTIWQAMGAGADAPGLADVLAAGNSAPTDSTAATGSFKMGLGGHVGSWSGNAGGTEIAVDVANAFAGNLIDAQKNGSSKFSVDSAGALSAAGSVTVAGTANAFTGTPPGSATASLVRLGPAIAGGSGSGTYLGANPAAFSGDYVNFQKNGTVELRVDNLGDVVSNGGATFGGLPALSATSSLVALGSGTIAGGSANGTYLGANPATYTGDFLDFQVNGTKEFTLDNAGNVTGAAKVKGANLQATALGNASGNYVSVDASGNLVDNTGTPQTGSYLPLAGGTMTGTIAVGSDNTYNLGGVGAQWHNVYAGTNVVVGGAMTLSSTQVSNSTGSLTVTAPNSGNNLILTGGGSGSGNVQINSAAGITISVGANTAHLYIGAGSPNGSQTGSPPDLYLNTSGGAATTFYVKESGTSTNTGWAAK